MSLPIELRRAIEAWSAQDPDPDTREALAILVQRADGGDEAAAAELSDAFAGRLEFGTAGLRGALGPGPNRMNRVVVGQAAAGLAAYLIDSGLAGGDVIIGFDARFSSDRFALDTAEIMAGAGFGAMITAGPLPTPVLAFGTRHFGCVAGVVVTASHNPPQDNGYKVYLGDGSQIVPPADSAISAQIFAVAEHDLGDVPRSTAYTTLDDELVEAYLERAASLVPPEAPRELTWVYTPLHGVGRAVVDAAVTPQRLPAVPGGGRAGGPRSALSDRVVPESRGAGRHRPGPGGGPYDRGRSRGGQRSGRRPLRGGRGDRRGVADAHRR